jgi:hypothetical protein
MVMTQGPEQTAPSTQSPGWGWSIAAMVLGVLAVFVAPVLTGLLAFSAGVAGYKRDPSLGRWAIAVAIAGTVAGCIWFYGIRDNTLLEFR